MAYVWHRWLADEFRDAGLKVVEVAGWKNRGRPASTGHFNPNGCSTCHHTGSTSSAQNPATALSVLISGRPGLPGPLCHWATAYDGTIYVIAAGRANHAGRVGKAGAPGMPLGADGNALALGNEVMTNGTQNLPEAQLEAIARSHAVVCKHFDSPVERVHRHADISGTGKWDIGQLTTRELRTYVEYALEDDVVSQADMEQIVKMLLNTDISNKGEKPLSVRQALRQASNAPRVVRQEHKKHDQHDSDPNT